MAYRHLLVLLLCVAATLLSCQRSPVIKIGFIGGFSGRYADFTRDGCNGFLLAVEEQNQRGGLSGQPIEVVIKDDHQSERQLIQVVTELSHEQVAGVVGPLTSAMSVAAAPQATSLNLPLISPTTSTSYLEAQEDCFFRIYPTNHVAALQLAEVAYHRAQLRIVNIVYDENNLAHCRDWQHNFSVAFEALGGRIGQVVPFSSGREQGLTALGRQLAELPGEGLFILAGALDSAVLAQQVRKAGGRQQLLFSEWSTSASLLRYGGHAVEGALFLRTLDQTCTQPDYLKFVDRYRRRYGVVPNFAAIQSYDSARLLFSAWEKKRDGQDLCQALKAHGTFKGLQVDLTLDRYGDVQRALFLTTVRDGVFAVVEE